MKVYRFKAKSEAAPAEDSKPSETPDPEPEKPSEPDPPPKSNHPLFKKVF